MRSALVADRVKERRAHGRAAGGVGQHGERKEIAAIAEAAAARQHARALGAGIRDERFHRLQPARIGERTHLRRRIEAVADLDRGGFLGERFGEFLVDVFLHEKTGRRDADLPGIA